MENFGIKAEKCLQNIIFLKAYVAEWLTCDHHAYMEKAQIAIYASEDDLP